jgi:hypothetical protein
MIRYDLICKKGHAFDAWFRNSAGFDELQKAKLVVCPHCGSKQVEKALMAPRLSLNGGAYRAAEKATEAAAVEERAEALDVASAKRKRKSKAAPEAPQPAQTQATGLDPNVMQALREIRREVTSKAEYVGKRFAEEARKIHLEEAPARGIYGEASIEDVKKLAEDGIECAPLPVLPEDHN